MQLNNLDHITNFIMAKISRIAYLLNSQRGNVILISVFAFYFIFHSLKNTFLNFNCAEKALKKDD
ncbi:MAG: hypothetical protein CVU62_09505 [Deltaproteobacteria bacterium HGW-Deltaproteobacteria-2]|nr:MAG: hypothetical protein CVU62_09505 [Deltaproteobacteria bacterium HGW-Deltaproteobacteria-2]